MDPGNKLDLITHEKADRLRRTAILGVALCTLSVIMSAIAVPLIHRHVQYVQSNAQNELDFCKTRTVGIWQEIAETRVMQATNARHKRGYDPYAAERARRRQVYGQDVSAYTSARAQYDSNGYRSYNSRDRFVQGYEQQQQPQRCCYCGRGEPGPAGFDGQPGRDGGPGLPGKHGMPGNDAIASGFMTGHGDWCMECVPGPAGLPGSPGPPGFRGNPGQPGLDGSYNSFGSPPGPEGPRGPPGQNGLPGEPGRPGLPGLQKELPGIPGEDGAPGWPGEKGFDGIPGQPGIDGQPGPPGEEGDPGRDGNPGQAGYAGERGTRGPLGSSGPCDHCPPPRTAPGY